MLKLSKTITARTFKGESWGTETRTIISVNYDPCTHDVEIESIVTESQRIHKSGNVITTTPLFNTIDVTDMFLENFPSLESDIMAMDWESEYHVQVCEGFKYAGGVA